MRRLLSIAGLLAVVAGLLVAGLGAKGDEPGYRVRAIFDNVAAAVPGEDVKVSGAKVGVIDSMDVTRDRKAIVVMRIDEPGFTPFRTDARCVIRPQSLIGEKFVECEPGSLSRPPLPAVPEGQEGEGQHLLPVERTSSPVDLDLVNNTLRRPYRERLAIILSELGTGLAGRGGDLNEVIHRANPALRETDRVLRILAEQNGVVRDLVRDSDRVIAPLARDRRHISEFVVQANATGEATAERRADISRSIERLPRFLAELRPTMEELGALTTEMTPVLSDLGEAAPDLSRFVLQLGPFSRAATPAFRTLGEAADVGRPALDRTRPLLRDLRRFNREAGPSSADLDRLTRSLDRTGAIERLMEFIFFSVTAVNGFDSVSHYLRVGIITNLCSGYSVDPIAGCNANFRVTRSIRSGKTGRLDPHLAAQRRYLRRNPPSAAGAGSPAAKPEPGAVTRAAIDIFNRLMAAANPQTEAERRAVIERIRRGASRPAAPRPDSPAGPEAQMGPVLDYLFGSDR